MASTGSLLYLFLGIVAYARAADVVAPLTMRGTDPTVLPASTVTAAPEKRAGESIMGYYPWPDTVTGPSCKKNISSSTSRVIKLTEC